MADGNIPSYGAVSSTIPEKFTQVRAEVAESRGDVTLIRASGEEVTAQQGTKIYLNDTLSSHDNSAVVVIVGDQGALTLGQNQQVPFTEAFFDRADSLEQVAPLGDVISVEALEQAIAQGQSLEDLLPATAAGAQDNEDGSSSNVVFYQRTGDTLLPVSGFETSTFANTNEIPVNEFGGDLDSNNQLNSASRPPVAQASSATADENTVINGNVSATDDGTVVNYSLGDSPSEGNLTFNSDGSYSFDPGTDFDSLSVGETQQVTFTYTATDDDGNVSEPATVTLTITGVNDAPVAAPDAATTLEDTPLVSTIDLDTNDTDIDGDPLSVTPGTFATTAGGSITVAADGSYTYTPPADFNGVDSVEYTVVDGNGGSDTGTLSITVSPVNDAPVAVNDAITATEDTPFSSTVDLDANDTDVDGDALTVIAGTFTTSEGGEIVIAADGSYTYTPALNFTGTDTVDYTVTDGTLSDTGTLNITVSTVDDPAPTVSITDSNGADLGDNSVVEASGATVTGTMSVTAAAGVSALTVEGQDISGASTTPVVIVGGEGTLTITGYDAVTGEISYSYTEDGDAETHNASNDNISDSFTVLVTDNEGDTATDTLDIQITDTAPTAAADTNAITEDAVPTDVTGNVLSNDTASADGALSVSAIDFGGAQTVGTPFATAYGTLDLNADGTYTYTLDNSNPAVQALGAGDSLTEIVSYTATDGDGDDSVTTLTLTVNGADDAGPTISITDSNGADLGDNSVVEASGATVTGTMSVTAAAGVSALTVEGQDISGASTTPVVIVGGEGTLTITGYDAVTGEISYSYTEDGDAETHNAANDNISDSFTVLVTDNEGDTATDTLDIQITDTAPTAAADTNAITEDAVPTDVTGNVLSNDTASADGALSVSAIDFGGAQTVGTPFATAYGTLDLNADGTYTYTLDNSNPAVQALGAGDSLTEIVSYTATDGDGDDSVTTLTLTVNGADDAGPTISITDSNGADLGDNSVVEASGATVTGTMSVTAAAGVSALTVEGQDISGASTTPVVIVGGEGTLTITGYDAVTGEISYSYTEDGDAETHNAANDNISDSFTVLVTDNEGDTATDTLDIQITDTAPTAAADTNAITEDAVPTDVTGNVLSNDTASADGALSVSAIDFGGAQTVGTPFATAYGTLDLNADGTYTYTLDNSNPAVQALGAGDSLTEIVSYTATDGDGDDSVTTLTLTVNGADDAGPTISITDSNGADLGDNSVVEASGATVTGTMSVTAAAGVSALTVEGQDISGASTTPVVIVGGEGTLTITGYDAVTGEISYSYTEDGDAETHNASNDNISDSFTVLVTDNEGDTATDTLDIQITDTAPTAAADTITIDEDTTASGSLSTISGLELSADAANVFSLSVGGDVSNGTLILGADGSFSYTPNSNYNGPDSFTYIITDSDGDSSTATVTIDVTPVPDTVYVRITQSSTTLDEDGVDTIVYTVELLDGSGPAASPVIIPAGESVFVDLAYTGSATPDSAATGIDYATAGGLPGQVEISGGSSTSFTVTAVDDGLVEGNETIVVSIVDLVNGTSFIDDLLLHPETQVTATVIDGDTAGVSSVSSAEALEGDLLVHTVTLSAPSAGIETFDFSITPTNPDFFASDYGSITFTNGVTLSITSALPDGTLTGTIDVPAGVSSFDVNIPASDDAFNEITETYSLTVDTVSASGTIIDTDVRDVNPDEASVFESGLTGGSEEGDPAAPTVVTGNVLANDGNPSDVDVITSVNGVTPDANGVITITSTTPDGAGGTVDLGVLTLYTLDFAGNFAGDYSYTLLNPTLANDGGNIFDDVFTYTVQSGDDGSGTPFTSSTTLTIEINDDFINSPPENTVPLTTQTVLEDTVLTFTGPNTISATDIDGNLASVQLTVTNGTLSVDLQPGATITAGGDDTETLTISGSEASINATLATLEYQGDLDYSGSDTLTVVATDSDAVPLSDTDTVSISVTPNMPPVVITTDDEVTPVDTVEITQTFSGPSYAPDDDSDSGDATGTDPSNLTLIRPSEVTVTYVSEAAGLSNSIGYYLVDENGDISGAEILWADSNNLAPDESFTIPDVPAGQIGFFLVAGGYNSNATEIDALLSGTGFVRFETQTGEPSNAGDLGAQLVYYSAGTEDSPEGAGIPLPEAFHASYSNLNSDGVPHTLSGIDGSNDEVLTIGFEDLPDGGSDWDLQDFVFNVEITSVTYSVSDIDPDLTVTDDGTQLSSASVAIITGRVGDELILSSAAEAIADANGISFTYDAATGILSLTGAADLAIYEDVLQGVQLAAPGALGSDPREIEYTATDTDGLSSDIATVNLNASASYNFDGDDFLVGDNDDNTISGGAGNDVIQGLDGADTLRGNAGEDIIYGGDDGDTIRGDGGNDRLYGNDGDDTIRGNGGDDRLYGQEGDDTLIGGGGEDIIFGGLGSDELTGGSSTDTFSWNAGDADGSTDIVTDFNAGAGEVLDFSDLLLGESATPSSLDEYLTISSDGTDTTIEIDDTNGLAAGGDASTIVLQDIDLGALASDAGFGNSNLGIIEYLLENNNLNVGP